MDISDQINSSKYEENIDVSKEYKVKLKLIEVDELMPVISKMDTLNLTTIISKDIKSIDNNNQVETDTVENIEREKELYTYENAIQGYRTRIEAKINESIFTTPQIYNKEPTDIQNIVPKGSIFKRKELFEIDKYNSNRFDFNPSKKLSDEFLNTQSIKERLQKLEEHADQSLKSIDKQPIQLGPVKVKLQNFNRQHESDVRNNNIKSDKCSEKNLESDDSNITLTDVSKDNYIIPEPNIIEWRNRDVYDYSLSPEGGIYINRLSICSSDLDKLVKSDDNIEIYCDDFERNSEFTSSELTTQSSEREDSGIHTADVSCSVSQADEPPEDLFSTIPTCIEKLAMVKENELRNQKMLTEMKVSQNSSKSLREMVKKNKEFKDYDITDQFEFIKLSLENFIDYERKESVKNNFILERNNSLSRKGLQHSESVTYNVPFDAKKFYNDLSKISNENILYKYNIDENKIILKEKCDDVHKNNLGSIKDSIMYSYNTHDNLPLEILTEDLFKNTLPNLEPPKEKPPPPPLDYCENSIDNFKRINSTRRIKKEIENKRYSFLGLNDPGGDILLNEPPDKGKFLEKGYLLKNSGYEKHQESNDGSSDINNQDIGLEIEQSKALNDSWSTNSNMNSITLDSDGPDSKVNLFIYYVKVLMH